MFRKLRRRRRKSSERHERLEDEAAAEKAMLEPEQKPRDGWSEADRMSPPGAADQNSSLGGFF